MCKLKFLLLLKLLSLITIVNLLLGFLLRGRCAIGTAVLILRISIQFEQQ